MARRRNGVVRPSIDPPSRSRNPYNGKRPSLELRFPAFPSTILLPPLRRAQRRQVACATSLPTYTRACFDIGQAGSWISSEPSMV